MKLEIKTQTGRAKQLLIAAAMLLFSGIAATAQDEAQHKEAHFDQARITSANVKDALATANIGANDKWIAVLTDAVKTVGDNAFNSFNNSACENLISVVGGDEVTEIDNYAFYECSSLTSASFPKVTEIGASAFENCSSLTSASFPKVTGIGGYAFFGCTSLETFRLPASLTTIGNYAFSYCYALASIEVDGDNEDFTSVDGVLYDYDITTLLRFPPALPDVTAFVAPSTVTTIGADAFNYCTNLISVSMPMVTAIGAYAFEGCSSLTSLTLGTELTEQADIAFESNVFYGNVNTEAIDLTLGKYVTISEDDLAATTYKGEAFKSIAIVKQIVFDQAEITSANVEAALTTANIGDDKWVAVLTDAVKTVGDNAFASFNNSACENLISVVGGDEVTEIGGYAFFGCTSLETFRLPASLTTIGNYAFSYCTALASIEVDGDNDYFTSVDGVLYDNDVTTLLRFPPALPNVTAFVAPSTVTAIVAEAFNYCTNLISVSMPMVTAIGDYAFEGCSSLTSVSFPKVTAIGAYAFAECSSLTSLTLGTELIEQTDIAFGEYVFDGNVNTADIDLTLGEKVTISEVELAADTYKDYTFKSIVRQTGTNIDTIVASPAAEATIVGYYSISGIRLEQAPQRGLYIVKYSDGTARIRN